MPANVQLIAGPARCGKMQRLLGLYRQRLRDSGDLGSGALAVESCWLAPNQTAVSAIRDSLIGDSSNAYMQSNLFTFSRFSKFLISRSRRLIRPISSIQKRRLLQHVIHGAIKQQRLEHYAQVASTPGFVIQVDEFIAELKRADIWPEAFEQWCQQRPRGDRRNRELSHIYSGYQQQLHQGELYDAEGSFWAARESLATMSSLQFESLQIESLQFDLIVVNGFNDYTAAQYDILRLLGECSTQLLISLTVESQGCETASEVGGSLLFAKTSRTLARLREIFPQLEIEFQEKRQPDDRSLRQLQHQFFRDPVQTKAEGGRRKAEEDAEDEGERPFDGVEILAANSELGEIEAIADRIKALLHSRTAEPQDIVVVSRGGESAVALIASVFPDYGIPFASESRPRLESEPLIRALLSLLRLHQEDWPFQTLLEVINNRLFTRFDGNRHDGGHHDEGYDVARSFATQLRVALEYSLRSAQLPAGRTALLEQLVYRQSAASEATSQAASQNMAASQNEKVKTGPREVQVSIALSELRQLDQLLAALPVKAALGEWSNALEQLLTQLGALPSSSGNRSRATDTWNLLRRGLREIERIDTWSQTDKQTHTLPELVGILETIAREQRVPAQHDTIGRVRILSAESARKLSTKHLFLMGLSEQAFSSATLTGAAPTGQAVSVDSQAADLGLPENLTELSEPNLRRGDAMLLFYESVTRPTESLTLSYPALDAKGQPLPPSPLLTDLERSVGEGRIVRRVLALGEIANPETASHSRSRFRRQAVDQALAGKPRWLAGMISHPDFVRASSSILSGIDCVAQRGIRDSYGPYEGLMLSQATQAALARRFDSKHLWSPSRLESYAACPFRFFAEQLLDLEPIGELTLSNDARRRGSLLHQVLATIHEQLSRTDPLNPGASEPEAPELVRRFVDTLDAEVKASPLRGIEQSLREIERREIEAWAPDYAEQEADYRNQWKHLDEPLRPALFEVRFGSETRSSAGEVEDPASTAVPFELDLGNEQIRLTGAIDRVDIGRVGGVTVFNIIDYKSGQEVKLKYEKVRSGHQLQLPLYALAAEQLLLVDREAVALATGYWNIRGKGFESKRGGSLQLRELADQTLKTSDDWQKLQPEIMARVQEIIVSIRDGQFPVYNEDEHCTRSCSLSTVCRVGQVRSLEKVWPPEEDTQVQKTARNYE